MCARLLRDKAHIRFRTALKYLSGGIATQEDVKQIFSFKHTSVTNILNNQNQICCHLRIRSQNPQKATVQNSVQEG